MGAFQVELENRPQLTPEQPAPPVNEALPFSQIRVAAAIQEAPRAAQPGMLIIYSLYSDILLTVFLVNQPRRARPPAPQTAGDFGRERRVFEGFNFARDSAVNIEALSSFSVGRMEHECPCCEALHFEGERLQVSGASKYGMCCLQGKVTLAFNLPPPQPLLSLIVSSPADPPPQQDLSKVFHDNWRGLNGAFAMTSFGVQIDNNLNTTRGPGAPWVFKIMGRAFHQIPAFRPADSRTETYGQVYIMDDQMRSRDRRLEWVKRRGDREATALQKASIIDTIHQVLHANHPFIAQYKTAWERLNEQPANVDQIRLRLIDDPSKDRRRYNQPTANEIAILIPGQGEAQSPRDIIIQRREGEYRYSHISDTNGMYWPMHYPLFFPRGEIGWRENIPHSRRGKSILSSYDYAICLYAKFITDVADEADNEEGDGKVTMREFAAFYLFPRARRFNIILHGRRLFQEYICDIWATAEQWRLLFIQNNQAQLRMETVRGLQDALPAGEDPNNIGRRIYLPSSHTNG